MSLQMLILPESSPNIYHYLAEYCNFQKNIGPIKDSMAGVYLLAFVVAER